MIDNTSSVIKLTDTTSASWAHNNIAGNVLFILFSCNDPSAPTVTYNGVAATQVGTTTGSTRMMFIYRLNNPATGSNTISITGMANGWTIGYGISFSNCDLVTPNGTYAGATGNNTAPTVNVTSKVGSIVVEMMCGVGDAGAVVITEGAGQTTVVSSGDPSYLFGSGSYENGATTVTMSKTLNSTRVWAIGGVGVNFMPATSAFIAFF